MTSPKPPTPPPTGPRNDYDRDDVDSKNMLKMLEDRRRRQKSDKPSPRPLSDYDRDDITSRDQLATLDRLIERDRQRQQQKPQKQQRSTAPMLLDYEREMDEMNGRAILEGLQEACERQKRRRNRGI